MKTNNQEIWEKFKAGDKSALSYIYYSYFNSLYQYGVKFHDDQEFIKDCIQDVFFSLIKSGDSLSSTENIKFYLFRALKNSIYKKLDKDKKIQFIEFDAMKFSSSFSIEEDLAENENMSQKEIALLKAMEKISARQREIIYLRFECGMGYEQICAIMQLKSDSARKLLFRAIKSLREIIDNQLNLPILFLLRFSRFNVV